MATAKKTAGKTAKIEGTKKSLSIKEIISMLKKGVRVINKKGRLCNMKKLAKRADQTMKREVWIQKAA